MIIMMMFPGVMIMHDDAMWIWQVMMMDDDDDDRPDDDDGADHDA
jgi:hypothetical protein